MMVDGGRMEGEAERVGTTGVLSLKGVELLGLYQFELSVCLNMRRHPMNLTLTYLTMFGET